jgi:hypothetical protein
MPITKITGQGLFAIACSVALLWSCLLGERIMLRRANTERVRIMHEMQQLQRRPHPTPVTAPMPAELHRPSTAVG